VPPTPSLGGRCPPAPPAPPRMVRHQTLGETTMTRAKMGKTQKYIYKIGEKLIWLAEKQNCRFLKNLTQTHVQRYAADMR